MKIVRTILALLIAISVAALPATAGVMPAVGSSDMVVTRAAVTSVMSVNCEHHAPVRDHGSKTSNDCASMAACAASCFNYTGTVVPVIAPTSTTSRLQLPPADRLAMSNLGTPPFRPPRV